ncbi:HTH-type transcriptional regulator LrpC [Usitatibacter rugosus]|uniref:HTH-type transcriptional regulator LrpC n=1 Tax=Usitatibacter rugosus TaxID=2732067 RepID=A0A6M4GXP9_9PROT|nr:Lrp/AsnC family transcriptional regulator [Usitatibacter rugosus]QJR12069.1 HTH-type transcriptional regulator LrpC [Usitatibacter rugosus]
MPPKTEPSLDTFDLRILALYQHDTQVPAAEIGAQVGLSAAAVQRRLKRLRETRVIEAETARVSPKSVGLPVTCVVAVDLRDESTREMTRFKRRMVARTEVQQCYYVTGQADFMLIVIAASMEAYEAFTREALLDDANVKSFTTHVVMDRVKVGMSLPIRD